MLSDGACADPTSILVDLVRTCSWCYDDNNGNHKNNNKNNNNNFIATFEFSRRAQTLYLLWRLQIKLQLLSSFVFVFVSREPTNSTYM